MKWNCVPFDLLETLAEISELLAPFAYRKKLEFHAFAHSSVSTKQIGDPSFLRQTLITLSSWVIEFAEEGEGGISIFAKEEEGRQLTFLITVESARHGTSGARLDALSEMLKQDWDARELNGVGLGMSVMQRLVARVGGKIGTGERQAGENQQCVFWIRLPFERRTSGASSGSNFESPRLPLQDTRILLVSQSPGTCYGISETLRNQKTFLQETQDCAGALNSLQRAYQRNQPFDLVVLDLSHTGFEDWWLQEIHALSELRGFPVILLVFPQGKEIYPALKRWEHFILWEKPIRQSRILSQFERALYGTKSSQRFPSVGPSKPPLSPSFQQKSEKHERVLLADDDTLSQKIIVGILKRAGYQIDAVGNGQEAVEAVKCVHYHLILMDVQMPVLDGLEASRIIRGWESSQGRRTSIIAVTGCAGEGYQKCVWRWGWMAILLNPFRPRNSWKRSSMSGETRKQVPRLSHG